MDSTELRHELEILASYRKVGLISEKQLFSWTKTLKRKKIPTPSGTVDKEDKQTDREHISIGWLLDNEWPPMVSYLLYQLEHRGGRPIGKKLKALIVRIKRLIDSKAM